MKHNAHPMTQQIVQYERSAKCLPRLPPKDTDYTINNCTATAADCTVMSHV